MESENKIALIIDCDNASAEAIDGIMEELSNHGETSIRRAYGNWENNSLWKTVLHPFAIQPVQQFPYTKNKNATDLAMTIDVMDILYTENIDVFAIVSSDSDFTPLAMKLRAKGKTVIGFGEEKTPSAFIYACNLFVFTDKFKDSASGDEPYEDESANSVARYDKGQLRGDTRLMNAIRKAIQECQDDNGWALAATVSQLVSRKITHSPKNFGYATWPKLIHAMEYFEESKNSKDQPVFRIKKK
ncbi:MAG: NYN domain-containing protein [Fibrobacter sp.]|nr:NYN domain-containing protein [Fibrobacter sp.]